MAAIVKLFLASLTLLYVCHASAQCTLSNITVDQRSTGETVEEKIEYEVVINNTCICSQSFLNLKCSGFSTVETVEPTVFRKIDDFKCAVNDYSPLYMNSPIVFRYAWDVMFDLQPIDSVVSCS